MGRPQTIGSLFAATLVKATGADLMLFSDDARYVSLNRRDTTLMAAQSIPFISGGTNFNAIFQHANRAYDRIVILSDMQGWVGGGAPVQPFADYKTRYSVTPRLQLRPERLRHAPIPAGARLLPGRLGRSCVRDHAEARPRSGGTRS